MSRVTQNSHGYVFFALTASQVFSKLADRALLVGISWYFVSMHTNHALFLYMSITLLPHLIMTFFSGRIINKNSPISAARSCELFRSMVILVLGVLLLFHLQNWNIYLIIALCTLANFFAAVFNPALLTIPKQLQLDAAGLQKITGLLNASASVARMIGPILALPLYSILGVSGLVLSCFALYFLAWLVELFIYKKPWEISVDASTQFFKRKQTYLAFFNKNRTIVCVMAIFFLINLVVIPIQLFMPLVVKHLFNAGMHLLSLSELVLGLGLLIGAVLIVIRPLKCAMHHRVIIPYLLAALSYLAYSINAGFSQIGILIALLCFGIFLAIGNVTTISFYQQRSAQGHVAQIMTLVNLVSNASGPLAMLIASIALSTLEIRPILIIYAILFFVLTLALFFVRGLREQADG
jgi:MFS family permease